MTLVLSVSVPSLVVVEVRSRHRARVMTTVDDVALITSVRAVRRIQRRDGSLDPDRVEVEAFIPDQYKAGLQPRKGDWLDSGYLRCHAKLAHNRKSLREFFESGELELRV